MKLNKWTKRVLFFAIVAFFVGFITPVLIGLNVLKNKAEAAERVKELQHRVRLLNPVDSIAAHADQPRVPGRRA